MYIDLRPYTQNTIHKLVSRFLAVAFFAILIPLRRNNSKAYSAYV
jgi:hypothetical protein